MYESVLIDIFVERCYLDSLLILLKVNRTFNSIISNNNTMIIFLKEELELYNLKNAYCKQDMENTFLDLCIEYDRDHLIHKYIQREIEESIEEYHHMDSDDDDEVVLQEHANQSVLDNIAKNGIECIKQNKLIPFKALLTSNVVDYAPNSMHDLDMLIDTSIKCDNKKSI